MRFGSVCISLVLVEVLSPCCLQKAWANPAYVANGLTLSTQAGNANVIVVPTGTNYYDLCPNASWKAIRIYNNSGESIALPKNTQSEWESILTDTSLPATITATETCCSNTVIYTATNTSITIPANCTRVLAYAWGAGGGGGAAGADGAGGGFTYARFEGLTAGSTLQVKIPTGGATSNGGGTAGTGGDSGGNGGGGGTGNSSAGSVGSLGDETAASITAYTNAGAAGGAGGYAGGNGGTGKYGGGGGGGGGGGSNIFAGDGTSGAGGGGAAKLISGAGVGTLMAVAGGGGGGGGGGGAAGTAGEIGGTGGLGGSGGSEAQPTSGSPATAVTPYVGAPNANTSNNTTVSGSNVTIDTVNGTAIKASAGSGVNPVATVNTIKTIQNDMSSTTFPQTTVATTTYGLALGGTGSATGGSQTSGTNGFVILVFDAP